MAEGGQFCPQPAFSRLGRLTGGCGHDWPPHKRFSTGPCARRQGVAYFPKIIMGQDAAIDRPILHTLANGPMHGYAIAEAIGHFSERPQWLEERELYAALHRLEFEGILSSEWNVGEDRRRAKYYRLRPARAWRPVLVVDALTLTLVAAAGRAAPHPKHSGSCMGATAPVTFSGRIGSVRPTVNGVPRIFVIDTASDTIVNSDRLHLAVLRTLTASTVTTSGSVPIEWNLVRIDELTVGGRQIRQITALAKSLRELEAALGQEVDGILGNDILNQWDAVTLDYKKRKLMLKCSGDNRYER